MNSLKELPIPSHIDLTRAGQVWKVPYEERAVEASDWSRQHELLPASEDGFKIALLLVDVQNTFCHPDYELFVGGRSGTGAIDDNRRLAEFIYRNLGNISSITATLDSHQAFQIFHALFLVDEQGGHPAPYTLVSAQDVRQGRWKFNARIAPSLGISAEYGQRLLEYYTQELAKQGKYDLTIWPYHAMVGSTGHALVSLIEEAVFFHTIARLCQAEIIIKGQNPLTEHYSVIGPEILTGPDERIIAEKNNAFIQKVIDYDAVIIAGQAKSHCVAWTVADLLEEIRAQSKELARKVYLLDDCSSPVVIPGVIDYTDQADAAYAQFAEAGMHIVRSTDPIASWPGIG